MLLNTANLCRNNRNEASDSLNLAYWNYIILAVVAGTPVRSEKRRRKLEQGFVFILALALVLYFGYPLSNWLKWKLWRIEDYRVSIGEFRPPSPEPLYTLTVEKGRVKNAETLGGNPTSITLENVITIDVLFGRVLECLFYTPLLCKVDYDPTYGYPRNISYSWGGWVATQDFAVL